jgi:hypothetical protein
MSPPASPKHQEAPELAQWPGQVEQLLKQIERWCRDRKWAVQRETGEVTEDRLGTYRVPVLNVLTPSGQLYVEPIARYVSRADGRVDLYAFPSMTRMILARIGDRWVLKTDTGVPWPRKWRQAAFEEVTKAIAEAA